MSGAPLPVVVNRGGGTAARLGDKLAEQLTAAFANAGAAIDLHLVPGAQVGSTVAGMDAPIIAVGGGDGTLGAAAAELATTGKAMALLPLGTRNHLARQLGVPLELAEAARVAGSGRVEPIDLARGNGRVFVNNASVGLYTRLVREREGRNAPKWLGTVPASWSVLRHLRSRPLCLVINGKRQTLRTPLLFIGNNRYSLDLGTLGHRESLSEGVLSLFALAPMGPLAMLGFAARTLLGRANPQRDFAALSEARGVTIEGSGAIDVAFDGEVEPMMLPLRFEMMPGALRVVIPHSTHREPQTT